MRLTKLAGLAAAGALTLAIAAPVAADTNAMVRVLHGSPDAPSVDVFVNDAKVDALSGAEFGQITGFVSVPAGTYSIKVCATADNSICPIGPVDLTFAAGKKYTVAASDLLASIDANVFEDSTNPAADKASVRVVHLSADTPAVDVLTQDGSAKVVENLAYPNAAGYLELAPATYDLKVCLNSDNTVCPDAVDPDPLALSAGTAYTVWAIGALESGEGVEGLRLLVSVDAVATPDTATESGAAPFALILAAMAAVGLGLGLRLAPVRVRR